MDFVVKIDIIQIHIFCRIKRWVTIPHLNLDQLKVTYVGKILRYEAPNFIISIWSMITMDKI